MRNVVVPDESLRNVLAGGFPDARLVECLELSGGVSAGAILCRLQFVNNVERRVVVRRPQASSVTEAERGIQLEASVLRLAAAHGIPVPTPRWVDLQVPAIVLDYVEGELQFAPPDQHAMLREFARNLVAIHKVASFDGESAASSDDKPARLRRIRDMAEQLVLQDPPQFDDGLDEPRVRAAVRSLWPWRQHNASVLLHGDYWPGNVLFRAGKVVAVLDWEEAAWGDPLADIAIARLDVLWAFGREAMVEFTRCCETMAPINWTHRPHWDLWAALRPMSRLADWAPAYAGAAIRRPDITAATMADGHRWFVAQALAELGL